MKTLILSLSLIFFANISLANQSLEEGIVNLQTQWAKIKYQESKKDTQLKEIRALETEGELLITNYPNKAEPKIWQGILLATEAGIMNSMSSLSRLKKAKKLFEEAIAIDPNALSGSAYTSLGSLYYQVPGWPVSFGDDDKAKKYLTQALTINPDGIDSNFFYADFLLDQEKYSEAKKYFQHALEAAPRPGRAIADEGRKQEIRAALAKIEKELN